MKRPNKYHLMGFAFGVSLTVGMNLNYGCAKSESLTEGLYQGRIEGKPAALSIKPSVLEREEYDCRLIFKDFQVNDVGCDGRSLYTEGIYGSYRNKEAVEAKSEWITQAKTWVKPENKVTIEELENILHQ